MQSIRQTFILCYWWWGQKPAPVLYQNMISFMGTHNPNISWFSWIQISWTRLFEGGKAHSGLLSFPRNLTSSPLWACPFPENSPLGQIGIPEHRQKCASSNNTKHMCQQCSLYLFLFFLSYNQEHGLYVPWLQICLRQKSGFAFILCFLPRESGK